MLHALVQFVNFEKFFWWTLLTATNQRLILLSLTWFFHIVNMNSAQSLLSIINAEKSLHKFFESGDFTGAPTFAVYTSTDKGNVIVSDGVSVRRNFGELNNFNKTTGVGQLTPECGETRKTSRWFRSLAFGAENEDSTLLY